MKRFFLRATFLASFLVLLATFRSEAQLRTIVDSLDITGYPEVVLHLRVMQGDNSVMGMKLQNFIVLENGLVMPITGGYCEDTIARGPVSVLLVIDVSRSMGGFPWGTNAIVDAKRAAKSFLDRLSPDDEAALMSFSEETYFNQNFTNNWSLLKSKIDQLNTISGTNLWDAVLAGTNVIKNRTKKKVMILLTDGQDSGSSTSFSTALAATLTTGVVVYSIGLGNAIEENLLRQLAVQSGGKYFNAPDASDLDQIYAEINLALVSTGICELRYNSPIDCWNGDEVNIEVRATTTQGVAQGSTKYTLPNDTSTFSFVTLAMDREYVVESGKRITVPLDLARVSAARAPSLFDFSVNFNTDLLTLIDAKPTGISTGYVVTLTPTQRGADIKLAGVSPLTSTGTLLDLTFEAKPAFSSSKTEISVSPPDVQQFCTVAASYNGLITISGSCERALGAPATGPGRATFISISPNPFNPATQIRYELTNDAHVELELSDMLGRHVRTLFSAPAAAGEHQYALDASDLIGGTYLLTLSAGSTRDTRRIVLVK